MASPEGSWHDASDEPGAPTHEHDGVVPLTLEVYETHDGHEVAHMETRRRGIEADVCGHGPLLKCRSGPFGGVLQHPAPAVFFQ